MKKYLIIFKNGNTITTNASSLKFLIEKLKVYELSEKSILSIHIIEEN